jgi:hypothetical protein
MGKSTFLIRSPTGRAWLSFVVGFIVAGEIFWELHKDTPATFFKIPFTDGELWGWVAGFGLVSLAGLAWLLALYLSPGQLVIDEEAGVIRRTLRPFVRLRTVTAPSSVWRVRLVYFAAEQRERGLFKRLELCGPDHVEVLLFTDLRHGEELARALERLGNRLGALTVQVEQQPPAKAPPASSAPQA